MSEMAGVETVSIFELLEDHTIPCELGKKIQDGCDQRAEWIMFRAQGVCTCGSRPPALACTECKDDRIASEDSVWCVFCGEPITPARIGYSRIEAL